MDHVLHHRGCALAWSDRGEGVPVLFVQGVGVHGSGWQPQTDDLAEDHRCLWFDNRGIGKSQPRGAAVTVLQMADDAERILDAASVPSAHVVGHSLGGVVAQHLALHRRERVRSLGLLCTVARGRDAGATKGMLWLGLVSRLGTRRARRRAFLRIVLPDAELARHDEAALAHELGRLFGHDLAAHPAIEYRQLGALRAVDFTARLHELAALPTLVVAAEHDRIAPPYLGRAIARGIEGARYEEIAGAGHGAPIQCADAVNRLLRDHIAAAERARR